MRKLKENNNLYLDAGDWSLYTRGKFIGYAPHEHIEHLSTLVCGYGQGKRIMAFFTAYLDASGQPNDSSFIAMAGYVSPTEQWKVFVNEWSYVLRWEGLTRWHMTDFNARQKEYKGWSEERCERVYRQLVEIIRTHVSLGLVSAVEFASYKQLVVDEEIQRYIGKDPYKFCVLNCLTLMREWAEEHGSTERVAYVLERRDNGYKEVRDTLQEFFDDPASCEKYLLGGLSNIESSDPKAIPCQAADILAWECRRELIEKRKTPPQGMRLSLGRLLLPSDKQAVWDHDTFPSLMDTIPPQWKSP